MRELAGQYPRYGDRKIRIFLARRGHPMSAERTYRLWRQAGLHVPAAAHHRQSGDPDRISAARRAQRPAHGRPLRESDRHHRAPGISRSWQQNGRITAQ